MWKHEFLARANQHPAPSVRTGIEEGLKGWTGSELDEAPSRTSAQLTRPWIPVVPLYPFFDGEGPESGKDYFIA